MVFETSFGQCGRQSQFRSLNLEQNCTQSGPDSRCFSHSKCNRVNISMHFNSGGRVLSLSSWLITVIEEPNFDIEFCHRKFCDLDLKIKGRGEARVKCFGHIFTDKLNIN